MELYTVLYIALGALAFSGIMYLIFAFVASYFVYTRTLKRRDKEQWSRTPDLEGVEKEMHDEGAEWQRQNAFRKRSVHILNDSLNLYGEYYDFESDRCVIILSGRTESLTHGYYFAEPYAKRGFNVLVIDSRAHGFSDGTFNTAGFEESKDALAWAKFVHDSLGVRSVFFHGICIGAAAGVLALTSYGCPDYIDGIVTEGMFANFGESLKNHMIERKKPLFLTYSFINMWMKHYTGHNMEFGPIDVIAKQSKPILFLQGKMDLYSKPIYAEKMFAICPAEKKYITWFEEGEHSLLRPTDKEKYDNAIAYFLENADVVLKI